MAIGETVQSIVIKQMLSYLEKDPENNIMKVIELLEKFDVRHRADRQLRVVKPLMADPDNNWRKLVMKIYTDIDPGVRKKIFENLSINIKNIANLVDKPSDISCFIQSEIYQK